MWSLIISLQYICIIAWIITSALNFNLSLTKTFIPLFFIISTTNFLYHFIKGAIVITNKKYIIIITALIIFVSFSSVINYFRTFKDINILIYSFIIPFTLFAIQFFVWLLPTNEKQIQSFMKVLKFFFIINAIVTISFFLLVNVFKIINLDLVWDLSIQNTVLMKIAGQTWFRTPGIFEIAGTNGVFLLIFLSFSLSKLYFADNFRNFSKYLLYTFIIIFLIFLTLTRRIYLCVFIAVFLLMLLKIIKKPTISRLLLLQLNICIIFLFIFILNLKFPGILSLDSFYDRLYFWYFSINNIIGENILNLFFGLGVLQSSMQHSIMSLYSYSILDNGFIECIMHSGLFFTLIVFIYLLLLLSDNFKFIKLKFNHKYNWIPLFNIFMLINMLILMLFGTFIFSLTESFIYFFLINYLTKYYYDNKISE